MEGADFPRKRQLVEQLVDSIVVNKVIDESGKVKPAVRIVYCFEAPTTTGSADATTAMLRGSDCSTSGGGDNRSGHPTSATPETLQQAETRIYRTDLNGTIEIIADKEQMWVRNER